MPADADWDYDEPTTNIGVSQRYKKIQDNIIDVKYHGRELLTLNKDKLELSFYLDRGLMDDQGVDDLAAKLNDLFDKKSWSNLKAYNKSGELWLEHAFGFVPLKHGMAFKI